MRYFVFALVSGCLVYGLVGKESMQTFGSDVVSAFPSQCGPGVKIKIPDFFRVVSEDPAELTRSIHHDFMQVQLTFLASIEPETETAVLDVFGFS